MKVTCNREKLLHAFQTVAAVAPARSPKPILQNVKLEITPERTVLMATDLEIGIRYEVAGIDVETPGVAVLSVARFGSILRESTDESIRLEVDERGVAVRGERSQFQLPAEDPHEFPDVAEFAESTFVEIPARLLREIIRRTIFATDNESSRYALGGVLLELENDRITAVGTDGRRLAKMEGPIAASEGYTPQEGMTIVPSRAMQLFERSISDADSEIQVVVRANEILVKSQRATIYSRLLEGRFPRWREVLPQRENATSVELNVGPFHAAVRQAAIVTSEESRGIDFRFTTGTLVLSGQAAEVGESRVELPIAYEADELTIKLDPRYVSDFLKVLDSEKSFTMELKDPESAAICTTDDGYAYVIMPLARDR